MREATDPRVAVYLDFDNIVMSWYDRVHGRSSYSRDRQRLAEDPTAPELAEKLAAATVDVGAIIDYAASFGSIMLTRAYADWSAPVNAEYRAQLVARAVDLVQLFPAAAYAKNGADIRLAVDAVEDMFRIQSLTHVVIVAGDSDYVPLAQRCKRLGCHVVGVGVAGSTAKSLAAACDEFESYENLPEVELPARAAGAASAKRGRAAKSAKSPEATKGSNAPEGSDASKDADSAKPEESTGRSGASRRGRGTKKSAAAAQDAEQTQGPAAAQDAASQESEDGTAAADAPAAKTRRRGAVSRPAGPAGGDAAPASTSADADGTVPGADESDEDELRASATRLLQRAMRLGDREDKEWLHSSSVKTYMRRMDPSFSEKALGHRSFSAFLKANSDIVELSEDGHERMVRTRPDGEG